MVIAAFVCFLLLIVGWFAAPSSTKGPSAEPVIAAPTELAVTVNS